MAPRNDDKNLPGDYEATPISRSEYIAAIVHLYRGELFRATSWRTRLDATTNWAIITTAGLLSFDFGDPGNTHWVLLLGILILTTLLSFEARRFRFFDVWRARVRKIEENFYGPLLRRDPLSPDEQWGGRVAEDLLAPSFKIGFRAALRARFTRNYWAMFSILLFAWVLKVIMHPEPARNWSEVQANLTTGLLPWWAPVLFVGAVLVCILLLVIAAPRSPRSEDAYWANDPAHPRSISPLDR